MLIADAATTATAAFAAFAALAAWATVATDWRRQGTARWPNVSAVVLRPEGSDQVTLEFVNMGPGLAIGLGYALYAGGLGATSFVGSGHLREGDRIRQPVLIPVREDTLPFVWLCRDVDQGLHVWSHRGEHRRLRRRRLKRRKYPTFAECFRMMYPGVILPPSVAAADDPIGLDG